MSGPNVVGMELKPTVALRALLAMGIAVFTKVGAATKAAGGIKVGAAVAAVSAAATAATTGTKHQTEASKPT